MPTLYRIYMTILAERLKEEMEINGVLSKNQARFSEGLDIIYNVQDVSF